MKFLVIETLVILTSVWSFIILRESVLIFLAASILSLFLGFCVFNEKVNFFKTVVLLIILYTLYLVVSDFDTKLFKFRDLEIIGINLQVSNYPNPKIGR